MKAMQSLEAGWLVCLFLMYCVWLLANEEYKIQLFAEKLHYKEFENSDDLGKIVLPSLF